MAELKLLVPVAMLVAFGASANVVGQANQNYPAALHGIWFTDDAEGKTQCRRYLAARKSKGGDPDMHLVGSQIVNGSLWHSYSEYGEGNFYALRSLTKNGKQKWRAFAAIGIDEIPDSKSTQIVTFDIQIRKGKLNWHMDPDGESFRSVSRDEPFFVRCASVPKGFY